MDKNAPVARLLSAAMVSAQRKLGSLRGTCRSAAPWRENRELNLPGFYHVICRGNQREVIFRSDADRKYYLERLKQYRSAIASGGMPMNQLRQL
jgi:hypothetical protein